MSNKGKDAEHAARMEMITNKAAKYIVNYLTSNVGNSAASVVSLIKALAIMLEASKATGENDAFLESLIYDSLKPAREEARKLLENLGNDSDGN